MKIKCSITDYKGQRVTVPFTDFLATTIAAIAVTFAAAILPRDPVARHKVIESLYLILQKNTQPIPRSFKDK